VLVRNFEEYLDFGAVLTYMPSGLRNTLFLALRHNKKAATMKARVRSWNVIVLAARLSCRQMPLYLQAQANSRNGHEGGTSTLYTR